MSGPDLHVFTLKFLALKKDIMQLFSADAIVFSKKFKKSFLTRLPFISTVQPRPQLRIDFSYYEISGPDICSLICASQQLTIVWSLIHHSTQPFLIFSRVTVLHLERLKEGTWLYSFEFFYKPANVRKFLQLFPDENWRDGGFPLA